MPLVEDVRASRTGGPDGSGLVVVEGVWGAVAGGPPPVLFVDDGARRHTLVALAAAPPDDPTAFRATFAVPADLVGRLEEGLALGLGRAEVPLKLSESGPASVSMARGAPVIARARLAERRQEATPKARGRRAAAAAGRRFDRERPVRRRGSAGGHRRRHPARHDAGPAGAGATVVERSVIAERRAKRSEQIAAVMERRARGAEDTAQEPRPRSTRSRSGWREVFAERDRLRAPSCKRQRGLADSGAAGRGQAERASASCSPDRRPKRRRPPPRERCRGSRRRLGRCASRSRAAVRRPPSGPDPFADALAKLRARSDLAAVAAPRVVAEAPSPVVAEAPSPVVAQAAAPQEPASRCSPSRSSRTSSPRSTPDAVAVVGDRRARRARPESAARLVVHCCPTRRGRCAAPSSTTSTSRARRPAGGAGRDGGGRVVHAGAAPRPTPRSSLDATPQSSRPSRPAARRCAQRAARGRRPPVLPPAHAARTRAPAAPARARGRPAGGGRARSPPGRARARARRAAGGGPRATRSR